MCVVRMWVYAVRVGAAACVCMGHIRPRTCLIVVGPLNDDNHAHMYLRVFSQKKLEQYFSLFPCVWFRKGGDSNHVRDGDEYYIRM